MTVLANTVRLWKNVAVLANTVTFLSLYTTISTSVPVNTELSGHAKPKLLTNTMGQCGDPGEDVSVIADRYFEKLGSIADQGPQARGLQW